MMTDQGDELCAIEREIWRRWTSAVSDRNDAFRTLAVATYGLDGAPRARMVILRRTDEDASWLEFHTDARSSKVEEIHHEPRVALLVWDDATQVQVRAEGQARCFAMSTPEGAQAFESLSNAARNAYRSDVAAGTPIASPDAVQFSTSAECDPAERHFVLVRFTVERLDWLSLTPKGQRRAEIVYQPDGAIRRWIAP